MREMNVVSGQVATWQLLKKIGEGDAGEVYLVENLVDRQRAILKRPQISAFSADIVRQSNQIAHEAKILNGMHGFKAQITHNLVRIPKLLDRAKPEHENSAQFFIVMEKARGVDLALLSKALRSKEEGSHENMAELEEVDRAFIQKIIKHGKLPPLIYLSCLDSVITLFEEIHHYPIEIDDIERSGILWNDVKPDHLFWDVENRLCMIIDWGNAQVLQPDGTSRDRLFSTLDDYRQFVDGFGSFLAATYPELHKMLEWPKTPIPLNQCFQETQRIREKVEEILSEQLQVVSNQKKREANLLQVQTPRVGHIRDIEKIHTALYSSGIMPDYEGANKLALQLAKNLIAEKKFIEFNWVAEWARSLPSGNQSHWQMLSTITEFALKDQNNISPGFVKAIEDGLNRDWGDVLWHVLSLTEMSAAMDWLPTFSKTLRHIQLNIAMDTPTPLEGVQEFVRLLEAEINPKMSAVSNGDNLFDPPKKFLGMNEKNRLFQSWLNQLIKVIIPKWQQLEPSPPYAGLEYLDVYKLGSEIGEYYPDAQRYLERVLYQPQAQMRIALDAWERRDFEFVSKALRKFLLWDPNRWRVIPAEQLIGKLEDFIDAVSLGPSENERVSDFATKYEVIGREYKNRIGKAAWLENILFALKSLRKKETPATLAVQYPETIKDLPWLKKYLHRSPMPSSQLNMSMKQQNHVSQLIVLDRKIKNQISKQFFEGIVEAGFGVEGDLILKEPLDLWKPEAQGSSARVFQGFAKMNNGNLKQRAIKIMRPDQIDYALPLFEEEVKIIQQIYDIPGVTTISECGFLKPDLEIDQYNTFFRDIQLSKGALLRYGFENFDAYLEQLPILSRAGWLPYLALEKKNYEDNLLILCDAGHTNGQMMPVKLGLVIATQICDIMSQAHKRNIVYRDHKILHYYWQDVYNGVFIIDWNVAKLFDRTLTDSEKQFDLVQFGARAFHHILTGRPAPGALPLGPTRPEEIELASQKYNVSWTFDDNRLNYRVKEIVESTLVGEYTDAIHLKADILEVFHKNEFWN